MTSLVTAWTFVNDVDTLQQDQHALTIAMTKRVAARKTKGSETNLKNPTYWDQQ